MNKEGSIPNTSNNPVILVFNIGQKGQDPNDPIDLSDFQIAPQLQAIQAALSALQAHGQQLSKGVKGEKAKEGDGEGSKDSKKKECTKDLIFCYGRLRAAIADVLHKFRRFDSSNAMPKGKLIKMVREMTNFDISKDQTSPVPTLSTKGKQAIDKIINAGYMEENEIGYYLTPKGKEVYEAKLKQWEKFLKRDSGEAAKECSGSKEIGDSVNVNRENEDKEEEEEERSSSSEGDNEGTNNAHEDDLIKNSLFICGIYRLMRKNSRKLNFALAELSEEAHKIQEEFPGVGFIYNKGILEQNIIYGHIAKKKGKYCLTEKGVKEAEEIYSKYPGNEGEPSKKRQKLQQKTLSFQQPPPKPKKRIFLNLITPSPSPPLSSAPKNLEIQPPQSSRSLITPQQPPPQGPSEIPVNKLISTKKLFQKLSVLVSFELKTKIGSELGRKLTDHNITLSQRMFPFECCLFCNGMTKEYVINTILVILTVEKGKTLYEQENVRQTLDRVKTIGFHKVVVIGTTDRTRERCTEYEFRYKKVSNREEIVNYIATQAKLISERVSTPFDAVPLEEIHF